MVMKKMITESSTTNSCLLMEKQAKFAYTPELVKPKMYS